MNTYRARAPPRQPLAAPFPPPWERTQRRIYNIMSYNVLLDYSILHDIAQYHMILVKLNLFMCTCVYLHIYIYIHTYIHTSLSLSLSTYIYIYTYRRRRLSTRSDGEARGKGLHARTHESEIMLESFSCRLDISSKVHWECDNMLESTIEHPLGNAMPFRHSYKHMFDERITPG